MRPVDEVFPPSGRRLRGGRVARRVPARRKIRIVGRIGCGGVGAVLSPLACRSRTAHSYAPTDPRRRRASPAPFSPALPCPSEHQRRLLLLDADPCRRAPWRSRPCPCLHSLASAMRVSALAVHHVRLRLLEVRRAALGHVVAGTLSVGEPRIGRHRPRHHLERLRVDLLRLLVDEPWSAPA